MLIAGAALSLVQTAAAALKSQPGSSTFQAQSPDNPTPGKPAKPGHLTDQMQAALNRLHDGQSGAADVGRALRAYGAK